MSDNARDFALYEGSAHMPAFPQEIDRDGYGTELIPKIPGLSTREYFAAAALTGLCANTELVGIRFEEIAKRAAICADHLINVLNDAETPAPAEVNAELLEAAEETLSVIDRMWGDDSPGQDWKRRFKTAIANAKTVTP